MTRYIYIFLLIVLWMSSSEISAQTFTRINTGAIVKDDGNNQGSAWGDYDNDGNVDLFITHSSGWGAPGIGQRVPNLLYRNLGNRTFAKVTTGTIATDVVPCAAGGGSWGDYDNDGFLDLFTPALTWSATTLDSTDRIYHNDGHGNFTKMDILRTSSTDGTWVDYNNDGFLDLVLSGVGEKNSMFLNNRDGTFTRVDTGAIVAKSAWHYIPSWADFDNDGDLDVFWTSAYFALPGSTRNQFFVNQGHGVFTMMDSNAVVVSDDGWSGGGAWGDYDNDGNMDLFVTGYLPVSRVNHLYHNDGDGTFVQLSIDSVESSGSINLAAIWGDFDNDGDLDLFITSLQRSNPDYYTDAPTLKDNLFFRNDGNGKFTRITTGAIVTDGGLTASAADYDNDGFLDILIVNGSFGTPSVNYLYHNDGNSNHWVSINCIGTVSNRSAIGARIRAKATIKGKPVWQMREIAGMSSLHANNDLRVHFGFGDAAIIDSLVIRWPSGRVDSYAGVAVDNFYAATEGQGVARIFSANIYSEQPKLDKLYARTAKDSVRFTMKFFNLYKHQFTPYLICANGSGTQIDSVVLFDDGKHGDSLANDGVYGAILPPRSTEDVFSLSVSTVDQQLGRYTNMPDVCRFTTISLSLDSLQFAQRSDTVYYLKAFLRNAGTVQTVRNISVKLSTSDPCVKSIYPDTRTCADLSPGQMVGTTAFVLTYDPKKFTGRFNVKIEIMADKQVYWEYAVSSVLTGVEAETGTNVKEFALSQNYPNPFNPATSFEFRVPSFEFVSLRIYDLLGREVTTLVNEPKAPGVYRLTWDAGTLASGIYMYRLTAGSFTSTKKLVLLR